ncbi:hypothetical protein GMOD_00006489 [Pyrenophora seminiperda CCB06]|uniref:Uncharacterized protein n=1 Tax=Pyrenophora seminiperda CCB06 TaxID=1302712 RepID=A0A3M7M5A1_9PLEO|nr:hypothetical protein GMOD_00006489 [Pyrenophora seminiperda CCB06]
MKRMEIDAILNLERHFQWLLNTEYWMRMSEQRNPYQTVFVAEKTMNFEIERNKIWRETKLEMWSLSAVSTTAKPATRKNIAQHQSFCVLWWDHVGEVPAKLSEEG